MLDQFSERRDRVEADPWIRVPRGSGEFGGLAHRVSMYVDRKGLSTPIDAIDGRTLASSTTRCGVTALSWTRLRRIDAEAWVPSRELDLLRSNDIFEPLRGPELERLARYTEEIDVPAGRTFIREGEAGDRFYAIVDGEVLVTAGGLEVARLGPGGYVGEIALLRDVPRQASVTAVTDTRLLALDREPFLEAVTGSRRAASVAHSGIEHRLAELEPRDRPEDAPAATGTRAPLG
jgi:hypothetical protein